MRTRLLTGSSILAASVLVAICSGSASARDGFGAGHSGMRGFSGIGPGLGRPGFGRPGLRGHRVHGFGHVLGQGWAGRGWRGGAVYLDDGYGYGSGNGATTIVIDRSVSAGPGRSPYSVPSVTDVPSVAGIRQPPSAEPAFYVVNEPRAPQASASRVSGPRILERVSEDRWAAQTSEESFGARIIHLTVPVGAGR